MTKAIKKRERERERKGKESSQIESVDENKD